MESQERELQQRQEQGATAAHENARKTDELIAQLPSLLRRVAALEAGAQLPAPRFYTVKQAAAIFQISAYQLREWINGDKIKAAQVGQEYRIPATEIERLSKPL